MQGAMDGTAVTPQRQSYPDASEMPEVQMEGMEQPTNPLIPAMETVAKFVQMQEQKGNPAAQEMKQHLTAFMQAAMKGGQGMPNQPPKEDVRVEVPEEEAPVEKPEMGNRNQNIQPLV